MDTQHWFAYIEIEEPVWSMIGMWHAQKRVWSVHEFLTVDKDGIMTRYEENHNVMLF